MQYKIQIDSNIKELKSDLVTASKIVDKITTKLSKQQTLKVNVGETVNKRLTQPLKTAESTIKKIGNTVIKVPVTFTGSVAVKTLTKSFSVLTGGVKSTIKYLKEMTMQLRITENGMNFLLRSNNAIGSTMAYVTTSSIDEFIKLEHALNRVRAVAGENKEVYHKLKDATLEVAESSSLTARQIAKGSEIFALAGFKVNEIIGIQDRLVTSVVNSGESIQTNADNITSSIRVWDTEISLLDDTIDKLTAGMANAKTTVGELGRGAAYAGNIFKQTGQGTSSLVSSLQAMADQSIKGATAGKGLSTIMQRFAAPTERAAVLLDEYGVSLVKAGSNAAQKDKVLLGLSTTINDTNTLINQMSIAYGRGETTIKPYLAELENLGIKTRTATGRYKSFNHIVEQLIQKNNKAHDAQVLVNTQFGNANRITNKLALEISKLGVDVGLSGGSMKGIIPVAEELAVKFKDISQAERLAFASDLAGKHQAPKLLALVNAAEKAKYSIDILGQSFDVYTSKLSLNQAKNDLATVSGRKFATVFQSLGGSVDALIPAVRDFNVQIDHNSKTIVGANGSVDLFIQSILRFKSAGVSWSEAILKATDASKIMQQDTNNLNTVLARLGSRTEFTDLNSALDELKRHIDRSSDTQVLHVFQGVMDQDLANSLVIAAQNGAKFSNEMRSQLSSIIGKSKEMRNEIEDTTKHILDRLISTWQSTRTKIGEALQPIVDKLLEVGIIGSQVLGDLLPPMISGLVSWLEQFDFSADNVRATMIKFFEIVEKVGKGIYDVFITILNSSGASSITFDGIVKGVVDTLRIFVTVIEGVGKGLSWLGLISDTKAASMEASFNRLDTTFDRITSNVSNNIDSTVVKTKYWEQENSTSTANIKSDFDITKNNIFSFGDEVSRDMHQTATDVTTSVQSMSTGVTTNATEMSINTSSQIEDMARNVSSSSALMSQNVQLNTETMKTNTTATVNQLSSNVPLLTEQMKTQTITSVGDMAVQVPVVAEQMKVETETKVQEMVQSVSNEATSMQNQATSETENMKTQVSDNVELMKQETTEKTNSLVSDMAAMFTSMKDSVVAEASSMYQQVSTMASNAVQAASNAKNTITEYMSTSSISDFMGSSSISDYMSQPSSITQSMQDTTINTNSTGLLNAINSGTHFVPESVMEYDNAMAVRNGADPRYLPPDSYNAGVASVYGVSPGIGHDYEPWWQAYSQTNPEKYQEYVDAGLHDGSYLQPQAAASNIIQTHNADGSITYSNVNDTAQDQLNETRKTNDILENVFQAGNFYISVT